MQNDECKMQNDCVAFVDYFDYFRRTAPAGAFRSATAQRVALGAEIIPQFCILNSAFCISHVSAINSNLHTYGIIHILPLYASTFQRKVPLPFGQRHDVNVASDYMYFFISSVAFAGSSETVKVRFMLLTSANLAAQARNSSQTALSPPMGLPMVRYRLST